MSLPTENLSPISKSDNPWRGIAPTDAAQAIGWEGDFPEVRQSSLKNWFKCRRYFMFRNRFGLVRKGTGNRRRALDVGTFFHLLIAHRYAGSDAFAANSAVGKIMADHTEAFQKEQPLGDLAAFTRELEQDYSLAQVMVDIFLRFYPWEADQWEVLGLETEIRGHYLGTKHPIGCTVDQIIRNKTNGEIWAVDHKTTSLNPLTRATTMTFEVQPVLYRLLLQTAIRSGALAGVDKDAQVVGFVHNVIKKPTIRLRKEDTYDVYLTRCLEWYQGIGEFAKNALLWKDNPPVLQSWVRWPAEEPGEEFRSVVYEGVRASRCHTDLWKFPRDPSGTACTEFNSECEYLPLCRSNPLTWRNQIEKSYDREQLVVPTETK